MLDALIERLLDAEMKRDRDALLRARVEFLDRTGRFDDADPFYEARTKLFTDWVLLDRRDESGLTAVERRLRAGGELPADERASFEALANSHRGLFQPLVVPTNTDTRVTFVDLYLGAEWSVRLARPIEAIRPLELLDVRLVAIAGDVWLTPGMLFHPPEVHAVICRHADEHRRRAAPVEELLELLARMRMRLDRYHGIAPDRIYGSPERPTPSRPLRPPPPPRVKRPTDGNARSE
jgi:hypothetical protein